MCIQYTCVRHHQMCGKVCVVRQEEEVPINALSTLPAFALLDFALCLLLAEFEDEGEEEKDLVENTPVVE